ncbi:MAG: 3-phenylpropionate/trans-cinnamate dioxygenase ferredoxin reductase component [Mycobacterium sp.]|nr:3-phenylpropionate/trans-cinnamate dioxygenase ferredoxin reductase component [Mycobacterium sp.]
MKVECIVIIGGGTAAASIAAALRKTGFPCSLDIISAEAMEPYERPPLSKRFLLDDDAAIPTILAPDWYSENDVGLRLGATAAAVDRSGFVELDSGQRLRFDKLVFATGGTPRRLPKLDACGSDQIFYLRSVPDALRLRTALADGGHLVLIGAGFIGGELASSARQLGVDVTMIEQQEVPLAHIVGRQIGAEYADIHREHAVGVRTGVVVDRATCSGDAICLQLSDGSNVACDYVAVGVGLVPVCDLAAQSGIRCDNGILVDEYCRTNLPDVYAAGDVANHFNPLFARRMRVEHHDNAIRQGSVVAANLLGERVVYADPHWFWSDQYEHTLQGVGLINTAKTHVDRGAVESRSFTRFYLQDNSIVGAVGLNTGPEIKYASRLIAMKAVTEPAALADPGFDLKAMAKMHAATARLKA